MQVILFQNVDRLGMQGDVVNVAAGYFRNYLGPRRIAVAATTTTMSRLDLKRKKMKAEAERQLGEADALARQLRDVQIKFVMKATAEGKLFGSVSPHEIVEKLHGLGFTTVERRQVAMHEPIKNVGTHAVKIKLLGSVEASIAVVAESDAPPPVEAPRAKAPPPPPAVAEAPKAEEPQG